MRTKKKDKKPKRDKRAIDRDNWRTLHDMVSKENKRKGMILYSTNQLVEFLESYNKLLEDELNELVGLAAVHGWRSMKSKIKSL